MRIALVLTVKNENILLPRNIEFHQLLGVDHFFVYFDHGSFFDSEPSQHGCNVTTRNSVSAEDFTQQEQNQPVIKVLLELSDQHHTARQMLNSHHAILLARDAGIDWVISIDADEVVYPFETIQYGQSLKDFFAGLQEFNVVRFAPLEVCPKIGDITDPIYELTRFFSLFSKKNGGLVADVPLMREIYNPYQDLQVQYPGYLGHRVGKVAIRPEYDMEPNTVHNFHFRDPSKSSQLEVLGLLHYNHYSFDDFLKKYENFRERPDRYVYGDKVEYVPKLMWRDMVNDTRFSIEELRDYFNRYIAISDEQIARLEVMSPCHVITIGAPRKLLEESRAGRDNRQGNRQRGF